MIDEAKNIKKYFLGTLSETDAEEIELRLITDAEFEANVIAAENDLVEDRLDGALTEDETRNFDKNYLTTPERLKNLKTVALLRQYAKAKAQNKAVVIKDEAPRIYLADKIRNIFSGIPAIAYAACLILVVGAAAYIWFGRGTTGNLQAEYASLNKQDLSDLDKFKALQLITATPGSLRGSGSGVKIAAIDGSVFVRLSLNELKDQPAFSVTLMRGPTVLLQLDSLRSYDAGSGKEIRLLLPVRLLEKGMYQIKATAPDHPESPLTYSFTIE